LNCEHALITGVACDAGPADCPQLQALEDPRSRRSSVSPLRLSARNLALPAEYDAVRGMD
jgi:hypothetical protein